MVDVGDAAPQFTLPGTDGSEITTYSLADYTEDGIAVLAFYPFDFSPVCTDELCEFNDVEWLNFTEDVSLFGISTDSAYAHRAFIEEYGLTFPLLSDSSGQVCADYGIQYDSWEEHESVSKRALFVVDEENTVRYRWMTEDALESPSLDDVLAAMESVGTFSL
ncbi:redoxin domain-containing protein [Haloarchaeobius sp. TZWWS8]|uniref:redoxin domain-containing protein n=1 Tax=Haloarchaeobius sp. TZWWS8 TaxID=3446121 RepID=UPI003EBFB2FF